MSENSVPVWIMRAEVKRKIARVVAHCEKSEQLLSDVAALVNQIGDGGITVVTHKMEVIAVARQDLQRFVSVAYGLTREALQKYR